MFANKPIVMNQTERHIVLSSTKNVVYPKFGRKSAELLTAPPFNFGGGFKNLAMQNVVLHFFCVSTTHDIPDELF